MKTIHKISMLGFLSLFAQAASANPNNVAYARVVDARPIYEWVEQRVPEQQCWIETVREEHVQSNRNASTVVVGSILGGALGHAVGHGHQNKKLGTAVGAVLGAAIGSDLDRNSRRADTRYVQYKDVERCESRNRVSTVERLIGYDVTYQYNGQRYSTRMPNHPGERIRVAVDVRPLPY